MRVICNTVGEFLDTLKQDAIDIFGKTVRVSIDKTSMGTDHNGPKKLVCIKASAVVIVDETQNYLLEVTEECGRDINDSQPCTDGTDKAESFKAEILSYCETRDWRVLPGFIVL